MKIKSSIGRNYGWKPDLPDVRDKRFSVPHITQMPPLTNLSLNMSPVYDQGSLGSCTGNSIAGIFEYGLHKQNIADFTPSRLFIYFNERAIEGTINEDSGAMIRDGIKSVVSQGVCSETMWPYNVNAFTNKPSDDCYTEAMKHQVISYSRVGQTLYEMKACLAMGFPFTFGFSVYENFETQDVAQSGIMHMPGGAMIGGHAIAAFGYDDSKSAFLIRNSWGSKWGQNGYFWMPYSYATNNNLADDFWTIRLIEGE